MSLRSRCIGVFLVGAIASGCTTGVGGSNSPTGPSAAVATLTNLTITPVGGGTLTAGGVAPITASGPMPATGAVLGAFAQYSDGSGRYVAASWTTSDADVLAVEGASLVARRRGTATLTATFEGRTDAEDFIVEGGVPGTWTGSYVVDQCVSNSGSMDELLCSAPQGGRPGGVFRPGSRLPIMLTIAQPSAAAPDITGELVLGQARGTLTGINRGAGFYYLQGTLASAGTEVRITYWDARVTGDRMEGFINFQVRFGGIPGAGAVAVHLENVVRR
jgi:hypothetical protein